MISLGVRLEKFNLPQIASVVSHDELNLPSLGDKKTALFAVIPDNDSSLNYIIGMMYTQLFQELFYKADQLHGGRLPVHVHCVMDEFANVALPDEFDKLLSTMRSREVSVSIIIQNLAQLKALFEKQWESIVGNCDEFLYLGGNEQSTHKYVSELLGKATIDTNTYGQSKGRNGSYSTNWQISGRELYTPDEVRMLDNRYALLFIRGERAVQDDKYDLLRHPNIKLTADGGAIVHTAKNKKQLDRDTETLQSIARKHLCQLTVLKYQQMDGLNTALPYGLRKINALRTLTTESMAVLMPFRAHEIMDVGGTYCGMNAISHNLIIANRKNLINGNGFILGVSGSGKSFFTKREIVSLFLGTNDEIIIADPQNEYTSLVNALGGAAINLSPTSPNHINAMDLALGYGDSENPLIAKSEFVLSFIEQIMGGANKLEAVDKSIIDRCLTNIYAEYLSSNYTIQPPTLSDLYAELKKQKEKQAKELALAIEMISQGNLNMFAHQTNVDVHNRLIAYGIRDLGKQLRTPGMLVMTDAIRNRVARNRERGIRTHVILDEMHIFFANDLSAQFFAESWKQFRKDGALATGITQNVEDCLKSLTARTMLANSEYLVMLNQAPTDRIELAKLLHISDNQLSYITNVGFGKGLLKCGNSIVPFVDNFPKNTRLYQLMSTKPGEIQEILG